MVKLSLSSPITWLNLILLQIFTNYACASLASYFSLQLPSGRVLSLSTHTFRSLHPHRRRRTTDASAQINLSKHLFELIDTPEYTVLRNLHGTDVDVRRIFTHGDHISVPSLLDTHAKDDVDPDVWTLDGVSIVTLRTEILGVWSQSISLLPLNQLQYPGVYLHHPSSSKSRDLKEISLPFSFSSSSIRQKATQSQPCLHHNVVKEVEVALAYDHLLCSKYGHSKEKADAAVRGALEVANIPYAKQTCLRLRTVNVNGECEAEKDPYNGFHKLSASDILDEFARHLRTHHSQLHRDVALFLPGFQEASAVSGVAFIGAACNRHFGMAWGEELSPIVMAHEIAHLLSAFHAKEGIMKPRWRSDNALVFSNDSILQISHFIDLNPASKCITAISQTPDKEPSISAKAVYPSSSSTSSPSTTASPSAKASKRISVQPSTTPTPRIATQSTTVTATVSVSMTFSQPPKMSSPRVTPSISASVTISVSISVSPKPQEPPSTPSPSPTETVSASASVSWSGNELVGHTPLSNSTAPAASALTLPPTCLMGWNRWNLLRCTGWKRLATHKIWIASGTNNKKITIVSMKIELQQRYGEFHIRYRVFNSSWIRSIGVMLTMNNPVFADVSINDEEVNAVRTIRRDVRSEQIELIKGWKSCCRKRMRIYTQAKICRESVCKTVLFKLGFKVQCRICRIPRVFGIPYKRIFNSTEPQPLERRCPLCIRQRPIS